MSGPRDGRCSTARWGHQMDNPPDIFKKIRAWYGQQVEAVNRSRIAADPDPESRLARQRSVETASLTGYD